jgi:hypothetical protein
MLTKSPTTTQPPRGRQALAALQPILTSLFFTGDAVPLAGVVLGVINLGATIGATYASDMLKNTAAQMPKLIVPQDKNPISSLIRAAGIYQAQLISSLNAQENLANDPQFYYPLFSNVGLLDALANLNPLILASTQPDDQLGPNNPTAAAVTAAAWKALLPTYFHWVPINPTTESQSQNFDNFYPEATPANPIDSLAQLQAMQTTGSSSYDGFDMTAQIAISGQTSNPTGFTYNNYYPTSMAFFPAGTASGGGTAHPERFYSIVQANLSEAANGSDTYYDGGAEFPAHFSFSYAGTGLSVLGWKLVDANGVEIDPRTAAMVFPTGIAIQPVTDGPTFAAAGGGWYVNLGPPTPLVLDSSTLYETRANPSEVYFDWFRQTALVPYLPLSGTLNVGAIINLDPSGMQLNDINVAAPSYEVVYWSMNSTLSSFHFDAIGDPGFQQASVAAASSLTTRPALPGRSPEPRGSRPTARSQRVSERVS